ncbi:MAG: TraB/GumN family protein [Pseudomonadota bacterium]
MLAAGMCCLAGWGTARAELFAPNDDAFPAGAAWSAAPHGTMYRANCHGHIGYLFGTLHVGTQAFYPLAPMVDGALAQADKLVVELDTRAQEQAGAAYQRALLRRASYGAGDHIALHVEAATLAALTHALHEAGIALASVDHYKPWLLANLLLGLQLDRSGYQRSAGIDSFLLASAHKRGTPVIELESADSQLALFDTLGERDAERYLNECLRALEDGSALRKSQDIIAAWYSGDPHMIEAQLRAATDGGGLVSDFTRQTLLERRNRAMAGPIAAIIGANKLSFIGVGLLHLPGANGLPALLAQQGCRLERAY